MARARDPVSGRFVVKPGTAPAPVHDPVRRLRPGSRRRSQIAAKLCRAVEKARGVCTVLDEHYISQIADTQLVLEALLQRQQDTGVPMTRGQLEQFTRGQHLINNGLRQLKLKADLLAEKAPRPSKPLSHALRQAGMLP